MNCAAAEGIGKYTSTLLQTFGDPPTSSSDPPLMPGGGECIATRRLPSGIVVFAHHPEGDTDGEIVVPGALLSLTLVSSWEIPSHACK